MDLNKQIDRIVRGWPHFSPAEVQRLQEIVLEVLMYAHFGQGNDHVRLFYQNFVEPRIGYKDCGVGPFNSFTEAVRFAHAEVGTPWRLIGMHGRYRVLVKDEG